MRKVCADRIGTESIRDGGVWTHHPQVWTYHPQVEMKSINKSTKLNERFRSNDNVERVVLEEKKFNFLFEDNNVCHFMDQSTFEQITVNKKKT